MKLDLETLLWVHKNCCDGCKFNTKEGMPLHLACSIQFDVMRNGADGRDPECDKKEKE